MCVVSRAICNLFKDFSSLVKLLLQLQGILFHFILSKSKDGGSWTKPQAYLMETSSHVCIDGFSYLIHAHSKCFDNKKAETVLRRFEESTKTYRLPSRTKCDYWVENVLVSQFMLEKKRLRQRKYYHSIICSQLLG